MGDGEGEKVEPGTTLCVTEGVGVVAEPANNAGLGTNQINTDQIMATMVQSVAMPMSHGWERPFKFRRGLAIDASGKEGYGGKVSFPSFGMRTLVSGTNVSTGVARAPGTAG